MVLRSLRLVHLQWPKQPLVTLTSPSKPAVALRVVVLHVVPPPVALVLVHPLAVELRVARLLVTPVHVPLVVVPLAAVQQDAALLVAVPLDAAALHNASNRACAPKA